MTAIGGFGPQTPWPLRWMCAVETESPTATGWAAQAATEVVWALSGQRFGTREVTLRPCRASCYAGAWPGNWYQWSGGTPFSPFGGVWFEAGCASCLGRWDSCSCGVLQEAQLPAPVASITQVRVDGAVLVSGAYQLYDSRRLIRTDGGAWPTCNDLSLPDTSVGTWSVTAAYGEPVPEAGRWAVGELACEFLKAMRGEDCRLPRNVSSLARQGVTITFPDVGALFEKGRTGLWAVDLFLASVNPNGLRSASRVYRVDGSTAVRPG